MTPSASAKDAVQIFDGFRLFEFGDHGSVFACLPDESLRKHHIFGPAHKADSDVVDSMLEGKNEVDAIFRRKRRNAQLNAGEIYAFVLAEGAAVDYLTDHFLAADLLNAQFDQSIREQNAIAAMNFARKRTKDGADARRISQDASSGDHELLASAKQHRRCSGQRPGPNFGTLQIGEDGNGLLPLDRRGAYQRNALRVFGM